MQVSHAVRKGTLGNLKLLDCWKYGWLKPTVWEELSHELGIPFGRLVW